MATELKLTFRNADGSGGGTITIPAPITSIDNSALQTAITTYIKPVKIFPNELDEAKKVTKTETKLFDLI